MEAGDGPLYVGFREADLGANDPPAAVRHPRKTDNGLARRRVAKILAIAAFLPRQAHAQHRERKMLATSRTFLPAFLPEPRFSSIALPAHVGPCQMPQETAELRSAERTPATGQVDSREHQAPTEPDATAARLRPASRRSLPPCRRGVTSPTG